MLPEERRNRIDAIVSSKGDVSFAQLKTEFPDISDMTLRRDLDRLDREGRIIRTYGGVRTIDPNASTAKNYWIRDSKNADLKKQIALKAAGLIETNTSVYIDSGSTATAFCREIKRGHYLIYTSGLTCAMELRQLKESRVYLVGGIVNMASLCTEGHEAFSFVERVNFSYAFIGCSGYSPSVGFTCEHSAIADLKRMVIAHSKTAVLLIDSEKIGKVATYTFAGLEDVDIVVADDRLPGETRRLFEDAGLRVL